MKKIFTIAALAIAMATPGLALGQTLYDCAMRGTVSSECCCPAESSDSSPADPARIEAVCCTAQSPATAQAAPAIEAPRFEQAPVMVALPAIAAAPAAPPVGQRVPMGNEIRGPPTPAVPIFVQLCSFLI